ncbi:hypothetical protein FQR65_LT03897 [Abscondita terminalis]|nr:hypothetical protein FQR65_LT03897 [Abscondita terminalis]
MCSADKVEAPHLIVYKGSVDAEGQAIQEQCTPLGLQYQSNSFCCIRGGQCQGALQFSYLTHSVVSKWNVDEDVLSATNAKNFPCCELLQTLGSQHKNTDYYLIIAALTDEIQEGKEKEEAMSRELEECKNPKFKREWTDDTYQYATIKIGNIAKSKPEQDLTVWAYQIDDKATEEVGYLTITTLLKKQGQKIKKDRHIFKLQIEDNEENFFNSIKILAKIRVDKDMCNQLLISIPSAFSQERFKKLTECPLAKFRMAIIKMISRQQNTKEAGIRERKTYTLAVEAKDKQYNNIFKKVKKTLESTENTKAKKCIIGMRSTKRAIKHNDMDTKIRNMKGRDQLQPLHIRGLDSLASKEDVLSAV